jgi:hypothetical protein
METTMNPTWHDELEGARCVEEAVAAVRRYLGGLSLHDLDRLPRYCDPKKIRCDDDVDDLTFKLAQLQREVDAASQRTVAEVFGIVLHASLRISRLNRQRVQNIPAAPHMGSGIAARQMQ